LTDVPGLLRDRHDSTTLVDEITIDTFDSAMELAHGSMKKKLLGAREGIEAGVTRVILARGSGPSPVQSALAGHGTVIRRGAAAASTVLAGLTATMQDSEAI
jgi:acetylglutamate/LysW-gamma-L-alpha-aminoadipate kinase